MTPSGRVCLKKLLLSKLAENGGQDPFTSAPLSEDQLVTLSQQNVIPPRPPGVTTMPSLLGLVGKEYESLVLELFDTRKALEETRQELSHALYQNDAAVRVVARLSMERDEARQELQQWKSSGGGAVEATTTTTEATENAEPPSKRAKTTTESQESSGIPAEDLETMTATWQTLSKQRKEQKKSLVVVSPESLTSSLQEVDKKNWHKTRNKAGIVDLKYTFISKQILTAGRDKQLICYSLDSKTLTHTINVGVVVSCCDILGNTVVAALPDASVVQYVDGQAVGEPLQVAEDGSTAVDITLHPTGKHVVVTLSSGKILFCGINESGIKVLYTFEAPSNDIVYTSGGLHPDGLICAAGTSAGAIHLWDFKNQKLADTYEVSLLLSVSCRLLSLSL